MRASTTRPGRRDAAVGAVGAVGGPPGSAASDPPRPSRRLDEDALDAILGADLAPELNESLGEAFDADRSRRLRRRAAWYFGTLGGLALLRLTLEIGESARAAESAPLIAAGLLVSSIAMLTAAGCLAAWVLALRPRRPALLRAVTATIVVFGTLDILAGTLVAPGAGPGGLPDAVTPDGASETAPAAAVPFLVLGGVLATHLAACLFLPWTPRECLRPLAPLLVVFAAVTIPFGPAGTPVGVAAAIVSPLAGAPGLLVCTWRHGRERQRFLVAALQEEVRDARRELAMARAIHESMLPAPITTGPLRLHYAFEPVRDLGGDFLVVHREDAPGGERLTIVLLDVTGHGVAAALGATRLHGELQRTLEERPDLAPGALLAAGNDACRRILAPHAVFATAFAARLDARDGTLEWASAGHLPGMILRAGPAGRGGVGGGAGTGRGSAGRTPHGRAAAPAVVRLPATTTMLGVLGAETFDPGRRRERLGRGDRLVILTDGIVEARTEAGRRLEIDGTERLVRRAAGRRGVGPAGTGRFPQRVLRAVERFSGRPAEDDRVVVELARTG